MGNGPYLTAMREKALAHGDVNQARAIQADLDRIGYRAPSVVRGPELETTVPAPLEQAVPAPKRRGRPPKPKCEHGAVPDRCSVCAEDSAVPLDAA